MLSVLQLSKGRKGSLRSASSSQVGIQGDFHRRPVHAAFSSRTDFEGNRGISDRDHFVFVQVI